MPLPVERLRPDSSAEQVRQAISDSIAQCVSEGGRSQEQCVAMAHEIARRRTGNGSANRNIRAGLEAPNGT